jgi:hypothetical protein
MATTKTHWDNKPIWVTEDGAERPVLNTAISTALMPLEKRLMVEHAESRSL